MSRDERRFERSARSRRPPANAPRRAVAQRNCRGCAAPVHFITSPDGKPQICDLDQIKVVTPSGEVVTGYRSHWASCPSPPERRAPGAPSIPTAPVAAARKAGVPWQAAATSPLPSTDGQLELRSPAEPSKLLEEQIRVLAGRTISGWYRESVRRALLEAAQDSGHVIRVAVPAVDRYADSTTRAEERRREALEHVAELRQLTAPVTVVDGERHLSVFVTVGEERGESGHDRSAVLALRLMLRPEIVRAYLSPPREPGADG